MVSPEEYFYYLRKAFKNNHIHGYMIDCKANRKSCIYSENGKWVVSEIRRGVAVSPKYGWYRCTVRFTLPTCDDKGNIIGTRTRGMALVYSLSQSNS